MFGTHHFLTFLLAGITLNVMPGPDTMYIIGRSVAQGRNAGYLSVLGISTGVFIHTCAAAFGLSAILLASSLAFSLVKLAGAVYLIYIGFQLLIQKDSAGRGDLAENDRADLWTIYKQGFLTNLFNPKVALFFMAFLPQFVNPAKASSPVPFVFLGSVFIFTGTLWCLFLATMAGIASSTLHRNPRSLKVARRVTGAVFIGLGVRLAVQNAQ